MKNTDIGRLHHVGLVVADLATARTVYSTLGFILPPPAYPTLAKDGNPPRPFGAAHTHAYFAKNFIELVARVTEDNPIPDDAKLIPLQIPPEHLARVTAAITQTIDALTARLARFQGLHRLVFQTSGIDATDGRLSSAGVTHGGVNSAARQVDTPEGPRTRTVRVIEIGNVPEGMLAVAEADPAQQGADHPNGAVELMDCVLSVPAAALGDFEARYAAYVGRPARDDGPARVFDLDRGRLTLVPDDHLAILLPGERSPALPAFVAYAVAVRDIDATRDLLRRNGVPTKVSAAGDPFVPAAAALGAAVIFRRME
ncbi:MAG TPA: VOC family protein [Aliidongia sp.]|uniref:VOC family protein n=1 Tax=Aliidongia sp. TaxID=1914230 RepID=UPI002DDD6A54|nr:VOC family protein [Aliidongia sp.]HEV2676999.1 VOC family protein [Aliidongia sp.]